ncbi:hypothetical protein LMTR3_21260 [Bradyrhizobium sp. LMTR 3]|nr:hypothetical protein LMTR3_21260 [Bradyrhizobium sp. LMTR 3]
MGDLWMPYYSFDLVIGEEYKNQGGLILENIEVAADRADQLATELSILHPGGLSYAARPGSVMDVASALRSPRAEMQGLHTCLVRGAIGRPLFLDYLPVEVTWRKIAARDKQVLEML